MDQTTSPTHAGHRFEEAQRVRVSLREIRECTFRALSAHGASHGEASTAARMVVDAELQGHCGIRLVLSDLQRDPWPRGGVRLSDSHHGSGGSVVLGDHTSNRLLRHLPLAAHLAAAEPRRDVHVPGDMAGVACLDTVLLEAAEATQRPVGLVHISPRDHTVSRVALPDGSLGSGIAETLIEYAGDDLRDAAEKGTAGRGSWLFVPSGNSVRAAPGLTWVSAHERADARAAAALEGRWITTTAWWALYHASHRYLVGP